MNSKGYFHNLVKRTAYGISKIPRGKTLFCPKTLIPFSLAHATTAAATLLVAVCVAKGHGAPPLPAGGRPYGCHYSYGQRPYGWRYPTQHS